MAIKRKTISIKSIKLVKPKYIKVPKKEIRLPFVEPVRVPIEEIKPKKQKKPKQQKQAKKFTHNKPLVLTSKQLKKLKKPKKQKVKKPKIRKAKKARKSTFAGAFPTEPQIPDFSDSDASWDITSSSLLSDFYNKLQTIAEMHEKPRLSHLGADHLYNYLSGDLESMNQNDFAMFLAENPLTEFFSPQDLYDGGLGIVTGNQDAIWKLERLGDEMVTFLSYEYLHTLADSDSFFEG